MSRAIPVYAMLSAVALAGCGTLDSAESVGSVGAPVVVKEAEPVVLKERAQQPSEHERLLDYYARVKVMPVAELGREHDNVRHAYTASRSDFDRMRLAMILTLPGTAPGNQARGLELLDPLVKNRRASLHGLALLLWGHVQEQRRLESSVQSLQQNSQALQQKLDALRSLEKSLIERDRAGAGRK
ncbi:MAG: hypothetical protein KIT18_01860 [Burkholderiales bacterium]|nr:hypothetical protein [Burkholderiales bacterium]